LLGELGHTTWISIKRKLRVPFEEFNENDALEDCKKVIGFMKKLIGD